MIRKEIRWACLALALLGCRNDAGITTVPPPPPPTTKETSELSFLRQSGSAPGLTTLDTSFVATAGDDLEIEIDYLPESGEGDGEGEEEGEEFLELELDEGSLLRYPPSHPRAGQLFQEGDTITIRIQVDPTTLLVTLEPSGLEFDPDEPAELEIRYGNADEDYDGDGAPDPPENEAEIDLWRQEDPGDPWTRVGELKDAELDRIRADLTSFSRYALAI